MFRSSYEKIPDVEKIAVVRANALGDFIFALPALEGRLTVFRPHPHGATGRNAGFLHVVGMHGDGADDGLVHGAVLADIDLLALLGRAAGIHDESIPRQERDHSMAFSAS